MKEDKCGMGEIFRRAFEAKVCLNVQETFKGLRFSELIIDPGIYSFLKNGFIIRMH